VDSAVAHTICLPSRVRPAAQKAEVSGQELSRGDEVSDGRHPSPVRGQLTIAGPPPPTATTRENSSSSTSRTEAETRAADGCTTAVVALASSATHAAVHASA